MLRKINLSATELTLTGGVLFIIGFNIFFAFYQSRDNKYDTSILDGAPSEQRSGIPYDTLLTYQSFLQLEHERQELQKWTSQVDNGPSASGWSVNTAFLNCTTITACDTCTTLASFRKNEGTTQHYIALPGYTFRERDSRFFMQRGQPMLSVPHWDKEEQYNNGGKGRWGHYETKLLPFRYTAPQAHGGEEGEGSVLIPVTVSRYRFISVTLFVLFLPVVLFCAYVLLSFPFRLYVSISRGDVFSPGNIRKLRWIAWLLILGPFAIILLRLLFRLIYNEYFTADVQLDITGFLYHSQLSLIIGLLVLAVARAFQKGLSLQEEQDLTI